MLALFDVVATCVHTLVGELVILLLPEPLGRGRVAVLLKALYGTRKASRLWQRCLRKVLADGGWKASVIFAAMCTLGEKRGTLGCWGDDILVEADEHDLDTLEAHLTKELNVKVLQRLEGGRPRGPPVSCSACCATKPLRKPSTGAVEGAKSRTRPRHCSSPTGSTRSRRQTRQARRAQEAPYETATSPSTRRKPQPTAARSARSCTSRRTDPRRCTLPRVQQAS